jgi:hypothetical protein
VPFCRVIPHNQHPRGADRVVGPDKQKWIRSRSFMELLENALLSINGAELFSVFGEAIYEDLLDQAETLGYPMSKAQRQYF